MNKKTKPKQNKKQKKPQLCVIEFEHEHVSYTSHESRVPVGHVGSRAVLSDCTTQW